MIDTGDSDTAAASRANRIEIDKSRQAVKLFDLPSRQNTCRNFVSCFEKLIASDRSLAGAFWCETVANSAMQREWTVNVGRRTALERVAHMLCEVFERLHVVGMIEDNTCTFPVTQMGMADATGLSIVHVNRILQELRNSGLIKLRDRFLTIADLPTLHATALFSPDYLYTRRHR